MWKAVNPEELEGETLRRWYLRSPEEIERERQTAAETRYRAFFDGERPAEVPSRFDTSQQPSPRARGAHVSTNSRFAETDVDRTFAPHVAGANLWRPDEGPDWRRKTRPVPLPSLVLGPKDRQSHPVPLPSIPLPRGGPRPVPLSQIYPNDSLSSATGSSTPAPVSRPTSRSYNLSAPRDVNQQSPAARSQRHGVWIAGRQPGALDPARTEVFQAGPDGKLQPVPGWRTTGPFEFGDWSRMFDWGGVAGDLADITTGALDFMGGGGLAGEIVKGLGYKIGPDIVRGIIHGHHSWPRFLGGPSKQELAKLYSSLHRNFHGELAAELAKAGFPRVGGRGGGGAANWTDFFATSSGKRDEAIEILRKVTRDFDKKNGTKISRYLDDALTKGENPNSPPTP